MLEKLEDIKKRYDEVADLIVQPEQMVDMKVYAKLNKEYKELGKIVEQYFLYRNLLNNIQGVKEILQTEKDPDFRVMAKLEKDELEPQVAILEEKIKEMLIPKDPNDSKDIILEIRGGAGGDESSIFAGDLFRMYQRFAEKKKWKMETIDFTDGVSGGYKEIIVSVSGEDVYGMMKYEAGVHRVQRVPETETQGRVHTSAATVAVLPEADDVEVNVNLNDIRKDTFCSSGPGGQSVNTTYSAVRLTHIPSGIVVQCQDEKSQIKNFDKALKVLKARIYEIELAKHNDAISAQRRTMVGGGDRSDKIRTYNYPQSRVTDHRVNYTIYNLSAVMDGQIEDFISELRLADNAERLVSA